MRSVEVVLVDVLADNTFEMTSADDQRAVQAFTTDRADEALSEGVGTGLKGTEIPIGPLGWHFSQRLCHDPAWPSRSSISDCVGCSGSSCRPDGQSRTRTSRSWCSATSCVLSSASCTRGFAIVLPIEPCSLHSAGCCLVHDGARSWSPRTRCCG